MFIIAHNIAGYLSKCPALRLYFGWFSGKQNHQTINSELLLLQFPLDGFQMKIGFLNFVGHQVAGDLKLRLMELLFLIRNFTLKSVIHDISDYLSTLTIDSIQRSAIFIENGER